MTFEPAGVYIVDIFTVLGPQWFPVTFTLIDRASRETRWHVRLDGPASIICPDRDQVNAGRPLAARVRWPDGTIREDDWP